MPGRWDTGLKRLIAEHPEQFIAWVLPGAKLADNPKHKPPNLNNRELEVDNLYDIVLHDRPCLIHFEFQSAGDDQMAKRMWDYNALATVTYSLPTCSVVIFLKPCAVPEPFFRWIFPTGEVMHQFCFKIITLWELEPSALKQTGMAALFPLMVLAKGGKSHAVVDETIASIRSSGDAARTELLSLTYLIASLAFTSPADKSWLKGRFDVMHDILEDTWAYKEIGQEALQKGLQQGLQQGLLEGLQQGRLEEQREIVLAVVQARFPNLAALAKRVAKPIEDRDVLRRLVVKLSIVTSEAEAAAALHEAQVGNKRKRTTKKA